MVLLCFLVLKPILMCMFTSHAFTWSVQVFCQILQSICALERAWLIYDALDYKLAFDPASHSQRYRSLSPVHVIAFVSNMETMACSLAMMLHRAKYLQLVF